MSTAVIKHLMAREIIDSRGNPTIEVDVKLDNNCFGRAAVPAGASTGEHEAVELRDGDPARFMGKGVLGAVKNVNTILGPALVDKKVENLAAIDQIMIDLDGTENKSNLGANAILGTSMALARAAAASAGQPLYQYLGNDPRTLPIPMMNIINGGSHADNNVDIQEFMIYPIGAKSFSGALQMGTEVFHHLKDVLRQKGLNTAVGDEGGFAPNLRSNEEALEIILTAIEKSSYSAGKDLFLALDVAASEIYEDGFYRFKSENKKFRAEELVEYLKGLVRSYPIVSIEDGLAEDDWAGWQLMNRELGPEIQIVGDDLTVTNLTRLQRAINEHCMNSILIKLNQIGTITETIQAVELARKNNLGVVISHRSGETEDTIIADFAVAMGMGQIKAGSVSRTDRICKYNQLLRIEEELGSRAIFPGLEILGGQ
ncbi:MAG: phosphopyruvate hydratase [Candidatus Neomarinimicrobiota bacterium]